MHTMKHDHNVSLLRDILPKAHTNQEVVSYAKASGAHPKYDMNLQNPSECMEVLKGKGYLFDSMEQIPENYVIDAALLSNVIYYDICERQAESTVAEIIRYEDLGDEFYTAIFLKLVDNYKHLNQELSARLQGLLPEGEAAAMVDEAKDILFAERFEAFYRYDRWEISDQCNEDIRKNPSRALLALLNNDVCMGAFWDEKVILKNTLLKDRLQEAIHKIQTPQFIEKEMDVANIIGKEGMTIPEECKEKALLRLIDIAEGKVSELSSFVFDYNKAALDQIASEIQSRFSNPIKKIEAFAETVKNQETKSLQDLVSELKKMKAPSKGGQHVK